MNWPDVPFESLYSVPSRNGIYKPKEFHGRGCRIVNMGELFGFDFISNQKMNRIELNETELLVNSLAEGDLLFGRRSLIESGAGKCSLVIEPQEDLTFESSLIRVRLNKSVANPQFFYYFFRSPQGKGRVRSIVTGTNVKGIRGSDLKRLPVIYPEINIQNEIVSILSAYDDLIENNKRRIVLLEESAQVVFNEWFIKLRFPGHERTPIINGVPEKWDRAPLESALFLQRGFDLPAQNRQEGDVPVYGSTGINGYHNKALAKAPGIVTGRSGTLGEVHYIVENYWPLNTVLWIKEFRRVTPLYSLFLLRSMGLKQYNGGVSVPTLDRKGIHKIEVLIPSKSLVTSFEKYAKSYFDQINVLINLNKKLEVARDLLLPKLISGEIAV